ncbi:hypothetical protein HYC85_004428 [Camellia sinensis]|uniref:Uncharacterized protein n=1 Tax=Camellia sinensis TaxID=4442 RepID=A0A7J7HWJ2_CAMSI|nr:hypothetical protein HYC85_004428 [Camellia sinensis]
MKERQKRAGHQKIFLIRECKLRYQQQKDWVVSTSRRLGHTVSRICPVDQGLLHSRICPKVGSDTGSYYSLTDLLTDSLICSCFKTPGRASALRLGSGLGGRAFYIDWEPRKKAKKERLDRKGRRGRGNETKMKKDRTTIEIDSPALKIAVLLFY